MFCVLQLLLYFHDSSMSAVECRKTKLLYLLELIYVVGNHKLLTILKLLNTWIIIGSITFSLLLTNHITAYYKISPPIASINLLSPSCFQLHIPCFFYSPYLCLHFRTHIIAFPISCSLSSFSLFPKLDKLFLYFFLFVNSSLILTEIIANMFKLW